MYVLTYVTEKPLWLEKGACPCPEMHNYTPITSSSLAVSFSLTKITTSTLLSAQAGLPLLLTAPYMQPLPGFHYAVLACFPAKLCKR